MTQRRRNRHRKRRVGRRAFLIGLGGSVSAALTYYLLRSIPAGNNAEPAPSPQAAPNPALPSGEWRAVWVSYLEFAEMDFSSESAFRADAAALMDNCLSLGLNTVIAQVRPFGDALYRSSLFPWSHLCTGVQGQDPGFDPLDVLLTEAHARGLSLEAWVNPYRLRSSASMPPVLVENSLLNTHPEWVCTVNEGAYLNPAIPEAADYVVQGVAELVQNYAVDGIHFDDYFYPTTDPSIDAAQFAASGETDLTAWRRANVTRLVKAAHDAVKAADPTLRFGVSPQGNPDNDRNEQYTDLSVWLTASGADAVVDYLCPQIYWGYGYTLSSGSTRFAFENITAEWLALPRAESTALYFGLGAYRVGVGDGGANADSVSQWCTGSALARQVNDLRSAGAGGWALYRYGSLFRSDESGLAAAERAALTALDG
ncbi:MAG: family 10 glycosylhydrolase [Faecalibacterium sp.]